MSNKELKRVYVISAPSGTGKTTLNRMLVEKHPDVEISVSYTDRNIRKGEVEGKDYFFIAKEAFQQMVDRGEMLEWANVHGDLKGTSKEQLRKITERGHYPLLEIDVQGWLTARKKLQNSTSIFILPPSMKQLWERLEGRGTDSEEARWRRMLNAKGEIEKASNYDYFIVNDQLDRAFSELERIVIKGQKGSIDSEKGAQLCRTLIDEFNQHPWPNQVRKKNL